MQILHTDLHGIFKNLRTYAETSAFLGGNQAWFSQDPTPVRKQTQIRLFRRTIDAVREVGTLLIAFGPLDASLELGRGDLGSARAATWFSAIGLGLLVCAIALESKIDDVQ
jgi:hypothetical protein